MSQPFNEVALYPLNKTRNLITDKCIYIISIDQNHNPMETDPANANTHQVGLIFLIKPANTHQVELKSFS